MKIKNRRVAAPPRLALLIGAVLVLSPGPSYAALGGAQSSIDSEQTHMKAARRIVGHGAYQVHELSQASGVVVREYVDGSGTVFAVAWSGPFKPDLSLLLGAHFQRFVAAGAAPHADHRHLSVKASDLVIESQGRMRSFSGRAYLPTRIPAGMSLDEIQ